MLRLRFFPCSKLLSKSLLISCFTGLSAQTFAAITANDDIRRVPQGTAVVIAVLDNDSSTEPGLNLVGVDSAQPPANGTVTVVDDALRYQPDAGFSGRDSFGYIIENIQGERATGTVTVDVQPVEGAVVASTIQDSAPRAATAIMRSHREAVSLFMDGGSFASLNGRSFESEQGDGAGDDDQPFKLGGYFVSINHRGGDQDAGDLQTGYDEELTGITVGADLAWGPHWTAGAALGLSNASVTFDEDQGAFDVKDTSLLGFASYRDKKLAAQAQLGYSMLGYDFDNAQSDGNNLFLFAEAQYAWQHQAWQFIPSFSLSYQNQFVEAYLEEGNLEEGNLEDSNAPTSFSSQKNRVLQAGLNFHVDRVFNFGWGVLLPRLAIASEYVVTSGEHEISGYASGQSFLLVATEQDQHHFVVDLGSSAILPNGLSLYVNAQTIMQQQDYTSNTLQLGFRKEI